MTPERWNSVRELLEQALALAPEARGELLTRVGQADPELRQEVVSLLQFEPDAEQAFPTGAISPPEIMEPFDEPSVRQLGPYSVLRELGRGGMGVVYEAERTDGQFKKRVAIKVLPLAFAAGELKQRFLREREILARLEHPGVTRLLDGGISPDGAPYLVMEFVDGVPLVEYAQRQQLGMRERLRLFQQVCAAVSYSHQHLIVHRDLKPANILVTCSGQVKLLDFGLAKILDPELVSDITQTQLHLMTPAYASPEQIRGEPPTVSCDIFSLGVVLYELLAERRPFGKHGGSSTETLRAVCEQELEPLGTCDTDLNTILLKALEKDPHRRYSSAEALAADLECYLEGLPIAARRAGAGYRARMFVRRNRWAVLGSAAAVMAILVFAATALVEARRAQRRFENVQQLANSLVFELHDAIESLPGATKPRELLVSRGLQYLDLLASDAGNDSALRRQLASGYVRLGDVQGQPGSANLGNTTGALESYRKGLTILEGLHSRQPRDEQVTQDLARVLQKIAALTDGPEKLSLLARAMQLSETLAAQQPHSRPVRNSLADTHYALGAAYAAMGRYADAASAYRKALDGYQALNARQSTADMIHNLALGHKRLGAVEVMLKDLDGAVSSYETARAMDQQLVAARPTDIGAKLDLSYDLSDLGTTYQHTGDLPKALENHQQALALRREVARADPANIRAAIALVNSLYRTGFLLEELGRLDQAAALLEESTGALRALSGKPMYRPNQGLHADLEYGLARIYARLKKTDAAAAHWEASRKLMAGLDAASLSSERKQRLTRPPWAK